MPDREPPRRSVIEGWVSQTPLVVPEFYQCAPDDSSEMGQLQDDYFERVMVLLGYNDRARASFLEIESQIMAFEDATGVYPTNDRITTLRAQGKTIAYTYEARTEYNYIDFSLVCTLSQEVLDILRANPTLLEAQP
jgi:hypothetical protein